MELSRKHFPRPAGRPSLGWVCEMPIVNPTTEEINKAAMRIQEGKLVAFPTETVYGLGANALDGTACSRIFNAKRRPATDPLIVHICDLPMLDTLVDYTKAFDGIEEDASPGSTLGPAPCKSAVSETMVGSLKSVVEALASAFWPGPLTLVLPKSDSVPSEVSAGGNTVGIRYPDNSITCSLIRASQRPLAGPSANRFGHVSPTSAQDVFSEFPDIPDLTILDGGSCSVGIESTVLSIRWNLKRSGPALRILRRGLITESDLLRVLNSRGFSSATVTASAVSKSSVETVQAPGQFLKHYAGNKVSALLLSQEPSIPGYTVIAPSALAEKCQLDLQIESDDGESPCQEDCIAIGGKHSTANSVTCASEKRLGSIRHSRLRALVLNANETIITTQQLLNSFSDEFSDEFHRAFELVQMLNLFSCPCFQDILAAAESYHIDGTRSSESSGQSDRPSKGTPPLICNTARNLFRALRYTEDAPCDLVLIIPPSEVFFTGRAQGLEASVFDRMFRSAAGTVLLVAQATRGP